MHLGNLIKIRGFVRLKVGICAVCKQLTAECKLLTMQINNKSTFFNEGDTQQSSTDNPVALKSLIELEFRNAGF